MGEARLSWSSPLGELPHAPGKPLGGSGRPETPELEAEPSQGLMGFGRCYGPVASPRNSYVEALAPRTSESNCIWRQGP